jgi:site-specific recombinase XerD
MTESNELIEDWKKWFLSQGYSIESYIAYHSFVKRFLDLNLKFNQKDIDTFRMSHMNSVCSGALKSIIKFLVRKRLYPQELLNIRFDRNKHNQRIPKSISYQEVQIIINNMPSLQLKILTEFIYELGLRVSEAFKVIYSDFNWNEFLQNRDDFGKVTIHVKRGKSFVVPVKSNIMNLIYNSHQSRTETGIPIGNNVFWVSDNNNIVDFLGRKEYTSVQNWHDYLDYSKRTYRKLLYSISKQHIGKRINPHILRHSKAQILMDRGMPIESIKEVLRHSQISSTEIYAQASPEKVKRDLKIYDIFKTNPEEKKDMEALNKNEV